MRRCATVAAIALCGALATGTAAPAFAVGHPPVVSAPEPGREPVDGRVGDDDVAGVKTEVAAILKEVNQLVADEKKAATADVAAVKAEVAALLQQIPGMVKADSPQPKPATKPFVDPSSVGAPSAPNAPLPTAG
ncbi:hypothetical protein N4G70_08095 [Streptomyces sp. ASQP_92]|uniref:hypothetical protein n=1 Tax=Streptomyces sp. ASQP_92 TaxID=2979116 RepID=UPI0021BF230C|nr:hypothetical protein [Streptomyces sp. ASQP_92]MCT9088827.1 hypothetical protein [Streptomyces sp. ASQP_92]